MNPRTPARDCLEIENRRQSGIYAKRSVTLVRGEGARVQDDTGRTYLDLTSGISVANLGHAHPDLVRAISEQSARLITCQEMFPNDRRAEFLERLLAVAPGSLERAFLCNTGCEAIEAAIKFSRLVTGRTGIVATMRGFHGRTLGALSATWDKKYREPFEPLVPGFSHVPYNDLEKLDAAIDESTAAVILEPIQGEGGIRPGDPEFLRGAQKLCRERGAMLVMDEIQTAYGRTGKMFACEHAGVDPDLLCLAKAMAGGVPMGAVLLGPRVGELPKKVHGSTFGGNALACAAAITVLDVMERDGLVERAAELGAAAHARLRAMDLPIVREVRGLGLMFGIELKVKAAPLLPKFQDEGLLVLLGGVNVLRMLPPLVITEAELDRALDIVESVLRAEDGPGAVGGPGAAGASEADATSGAETASGADTESASETR